MTAAVNTEPLANHELARALRRHPVIVETEFAPARTVEQDAMNRLGRTVRGTGAIVEGVLSVVLPQDLRTGDLAAIDMAEFRYATHSLAAGGAARHLPPLPQDREQ